ncbi:MAG: DUF6790 family protein [Gammaproteobacteria bacterium]
MYIAIVAVLMLVLPLASIAGEVLFTAAPFSLVLVGKWFVIWAVGVRLLLAGLRQILQPRYTAQVILSLKSEESLILVRELGFANLAIGLLGVGSAVFPSWRLPAALAGGTFFALAGANHVLQAHRGRLENVAMVSNLWAAFVLLVSFVAMLLSSHIGV